MQVQLPIFLLSLLVHTGIFLTSDAGDRRLRLMAGLAIVFSTWPVWYAGVLLTMAPDTASPWLGILLARAPYYLPLLSFLVYLRRKQA